MSKNVKPFFFYSSNFPKMLKDLDVTLAYTTYQAGKLILISSIQGESIAKYAKNFRRPMGLAYDASRSRLALASRTCIDIFSNERSLAVTYPPSPRKYDVLFIPQSKYYTGYLDTHEIEFGGEDLWVVNTMFSCISKMNEDRHFQLYWKPPFISEIQPEDRCHLNGLALEDGQPAYVTVFDKTDSPFGWKQGPIETGVLMDIRNDKILADNLPMPHSPTLFENKVYFLLSGTGEIMYFDLILKETKKLGELKSFLRGMAIVGNYLFVGASRLREESTTFSGIPITPEDSFCGIYIIDRTTGEQVGGISYTENINEIFAVSVLPNVKSPALLTERDEMYDKCLMGPDNLNYWMKKSDTK